MNTKPESLFLHRAVLYCSFPLSKNKLCRSSTEFSYLKLDGDSFGVLNILAMIKSCKGISSRFECLCPTSPSTDTSKNPVIAQMLSEYSC